MKRVVRVSLALSAALLLFVGALGAEIRQLTAVTSPEPGQTSSGMRRALVVLDLQEDYTGTEARPPFPYAGSAALIERINHLAKRASGAGAEVVYVRQVFDRPLSKVVSHVLLGSTVLEGSRGAEFDQRLRFASSNRFEKPFADAFSSDAFDAFLAAHGIGELVLVGLDGAGCVDKTARGARNRGLAVTIVEPLVASRDATAWDAAKRDYPELGIRVVSDERFL
jgi:nicotinamidase/pyrazinamidase